MENNTKLYPCSMTFGPTTSQYSTQNVIFNSNSLENQIWYHGLIKRIEAQNLMKFNGDFLVRKSISNLNGFVLTGKNQNGQILHFEINQTLNNNSTDETLYHVSFDSSVQGGNPQLNSIFESFATRYKNKFISQLLSNPLNHQSK